MIIHLSNGMRFNLTIPNFSPNEYVKNLNDSQLSMLTVGNVALNKTAINYIGPKVAPENANVMIYLTNGITIKTYVEDFNAEDVSASGNNPLLNVIAIGNIVINKHNVMLVVPIQSPVPQEPQEPIETV